MDSKSDKAVDVLGDSLEKTSFEEEEEEDAQVLQLQTSEQEADQEKKELIGDMGANKGAEEKKKKKKKKKKNKKKKKGPNVDQSAESTGEKAGTSFMSSNFMFDPKVLYENSLKEARKHELWSNIKEAHRTNVYGPSYVDDMIEVMAMGKVWGDMTMADFMQKKKENEQSKQSAEAGKGEKSTEEKKEKSEESSSSDASNLNKLSKSLADEEFKKMDRQREELIGFVKFMSIVNSGDFAYDSDSD